MTLRVLIVGSGAREHALAWKAAQSPRLGALLAAPGNAGTAQLARNVAVAADDVAGLARLARDEAIDLAIIGPEAPLALGAADAMRETGCRVFGPSQAAADIEASKAFAKDFMQRHGLPTARYATFTDYYEAVGYLLGVDFDRGGVVIKASGLAAGKGVVVPDCADDAEAALRQIMQDRAFGAAGECVVIEERLRGEEVSLLAFTDGETIRVMPPAQDHKRLLDGDQGPNTGGMGAYAPAPICPPALAEELGRTILQRAVDGLREEGRPFVGVLYAGLMLTNDGPRVLEFNCRLGDPEAEAVLPLLDSDLLEVALACAERRLHEVEVRWREGAAACVVLAAGGYPGRYVTGHAITGLDSPLEDAVYFHAGTREQAGQVVTAGGRVLAATGWGPSLPAALERAYGAAERVSFEGAQYRRDIGARARGVAA